MAGGILEAATMPMTPPSPPVPIRRASTAPACLDARTLRTKVCRAAGKLCAESLQQESECWLAHRQAREKTSEDLAFVREQARQHDVCALLAGGDVEVLLEGMEYFSFEAEQVLLKQGDVCHYFFVVHSGALRVCADGLGTMGSLRRGDSFGGSALLFDAPQAMSVVASEASCVWGIEGKAFRQILKADAQRRFEENCRLLDSIGQLDGLSQQQKARVSEAAVFTEHHEAGAKVVVEGEEVAALRIVKSGRLSAFVGGSKVKELQAGDSFSKGAAVQSRAKSGVTVVAETRCELICIGIEPMNAVLGRDHDVAVARSFILKCLDRSPRLAQLPATERRLLADTMELVEFRPGEALGDADAALLLVVDGSAQSAPGVLPACELERGQIFGEDGASPSFVAGPKGATLAKLAREELARALREAGAARTAEVAESLEQARSRLSAGKLPLFHHVPRDQIDGLAEAFEPMQLEMSSTVFQQGDVGADVWLVQEGELEELVDGSRVRIIGKNGHCGVRANLFCEPRRSSVRVLSKEALLWRLPGEVFEKFTSSSVRQELARRLELRSVEVSLSDLEHVRIIGRGGFGSVRRVRHRAAPREYALKRIRKRHSHVAVMVARECELLSEMDHPFILLFAKTFDTASSIYILTELLTGGELLSALDQIARPLTRSEAQFYAGSLLLVLEFLHERRVVFRDLKPENVMLDAQGYVKLIDFGTAKKLDEASGRTFTRVGSYHFMAPEVVRGRGYSTSVDLWSLGVMLFEFVCGYLPFGRDIVDPTGVEICRAVQLQNLVFPPKYLDRTGKYLMRGLLSKEPEGRLGSGENGHGDVRGHEYFAVEGPCSLFDRILQRQLAPPYLPEREEFGEDGVPSEISEEGG